MVAPAQAELGRIAVALTEAFNAQAVQGVDLLGQPGTAFFAPLTDASPRVLFNPQNSTSTVPFSVAISDARALTVSDYTLRAAGGAFTLTRRTDGEVFDLTAAFTADPAEPVTVDGLTFTLTGALPADGDRFTVQPTANALANFAVRPLNAAQSGVEHLMFGSQTEAYPVTVGAGRACRPHHRYDGCRAHHTPAAHGTSSRHAPKRAVRGRLRGAP
jgi:flagellar hook-associated protein 1 FlgK